MFFSAYQTDLPKWVVSVATLEKAKATVKELAGSNGHFDYFVFDFLVGKEVWSWPPIKATKGDVAERREAEKAVRDVTERLLRTEDQERRRLAREFHDGTSQILASMQLQIALLQDLLPQEDGAVQGSLSELTDLVDSCGSEIRTLSHLRHPPILDEAGLGSAIRSYAEGFGRRSGITVTTDIPDGLPRFSLDIETAPFRVTQEGLANIHRHSGSKTAYIRAAPADGSIRLEIRDQGCGIPAEILHSPAKLGVGIRGMTERIRLLGGKLVIESDERGTTVRAELPSETPVSVPA
jgi:two-component system NarL family sensor kinase